MVRTTNNIVPTSNATHLREVEMRVSLSVGLFRMLRVTPVNTTHNSLTTCSQNCNSVFTSSISSVGSRRTELSDLIASSSTSNISLTLFTAANQNSLFRSRDWLLANQGALFPDSVGSYLFILFVFLIILTCIVWILS